MFQHLAGEFIHTGGSSRTGRTNYFVTDWINRADVVNQFVGEIYRQFFAFVEHVNQTFVRGIAAGQDFTVQQQYVAGFPCGHFFFSQVVDIDTFAVVRAVSQIRPIFQRWGFQFGRA